MQNAKEYYELELDELKNAWAQKNSSLIMLRQRGWILIRPSLWKHEPTTCFIFHFGDPTTYRVESAHWALKAFLQTSTCALDTLWNRVNLLLDSQMMKINDSLEKSRCKIGEQHLIGPFCHLVVHVSQYCLDLLKDRKLSTIEIRRHDVWLL